MSLPCWSLCTWGRLSELFEASVLRRTGWERGLKRGKESGKWHAAKAEVQSGTREACLGPTFREVSKWNSTVKVWDVFVCWSYLGGCVMSSARSGGCPGQVRTRFAELMCVVCRWDVQRATSLCVWVCVWDFVRFQAGPTLPQESLNGRNRKLASSCSIQSPWGFRFSCSNQSGSPALVPTYQGGEKRHAWSPCWSFNCIRLPFIISFTKFIDPLVVLFCVYRIAEFSHL